MFDAAINAVLGAPPPPQFKLSSALDLVAVPSSPDAGAIVVQSPPPSAIASPASLSSLSPSTLLTYNQVAPERPEGLEE
jgi:hypothetical protein